MNTSPEQYDVVVVGAGTSGAAATYLLAKRGFRVCCLERSRISEAGARWVNEVPGWMFDAAEIPRPSAPEMIARGGRSHLIAGWGPEPRLPVDCPDGLSVDMRLLVERLQQMAVRAGAVFRDRLEVKGQDGHTVWTSGGSVRGDWVVDASGLGGADLFRRPRIDPEHLCAAAQGVYAISDAPQAEEFFVSRGAKMGQILCYTGVAGGFSVVNVRIHHGHLNVLTGSIPASGAPSGKALMEDFVRQQRWVGARRFGGWRAIPVCSPSQPIFRNSVAYLGDSACQVFPAHGSGIGSGLVAARLLADALQTGRGVQGYAADWHRRYGAIHAGYDVLRRFSQSLDIDRLALMMRHGLLDVDSLSAGLDQRFPALSLGSVQNFLTRARRAPEAARPLRKALLRIPLLRLHHLVYPPKNYVLQQSWWERLRRLVRD